MMKTLPFLLIFIIILSSGLSLFSQGDANTNKIDTDKLHQKIDSLTMMVDTMLMKQFEIEKKTNEEGLVVHTAVGALASSLGIGLQMVLSAHEKVNIRLSATYFSHSVTETIYDETVNANVAHEHIVGGAYLMVDYQFHRLFHATAGILYSVYEQNGNGHAAKGITIGGVEIPADVVGQISYAVQNNGIAPYVGVGFGRSISLEKKISFTADVGLYYLNRQTVELEADGLLTPTAMQKSTLEENAGNQTFFPYFGIQLSYRIF